MKKLYILLFACAISSSAFAQLNPNYHIRLNASIGTGNYHTDFYFNDNSTSGVDRGYDATVLGNGAPANAIYSKIVDGTYANLDFIIQSLHTSALGSDISIPLGINVAQSQQVTVSISESDLPDDITVYLEDSQTGTFTLLNTTDFVFTSVSSIRSVGRFFLKFSSPGQPTTLSVAKSSLNDLQIYTTASASALFVKGQLMMATHISLYDIQGRMVLSAALDGTSSNNKVDVSVLTSGVYIVKVSNMYQQKTKKVILKETI
ncbi:MAG: T9SS type A sorting domain-containing protein [Aquaticitalea sp.]